ncbi:hypothetical protein GYMLUDRAFT_39123 [Collybiopsis luxurians FD-317 M1]|nr:hypothetical protein GYMLUDRAFT_39123 [Collybiopsis luxurians FD-317 M1]
MFAYNVPDVSVLLIVLSLLYLLNVAEAIVNFILEAGLLGSLALGIVYGPEVANILPEYLLQSLLIFGYIGLILLVFEAGLSTNIALLSKNLLSSILVGGTGILLPIVFSVFLVHFGFEYSILQSFAVGASTSSTSLGTTLALLKPEVRQTRTGVILLSAALFDNVIGLVIAAIIESFSDSASASIPWQKIVRPILISVAFAFGTGFSVWAVRPLTERMPTRWKRFLYQSKIQLLILAVVISGFVAGANYAGTSELFGAYPAGVLTAQIFHSPPETAQPAEPAQKL